MVPADVLANVPTTTEEALALFDASAAAEPEFMIGTWHGAELPTGHPLDGLLEASGWWGKQFLRTRSPKARLRTTRYRGVDSATMIYDQLPINDVLRKLDDENVIGAMDLRRSKDPYFFLLTRDGSLQVR